MKTRFLSSLLVIALGAAAVAATESAPGVNKRLKKLEEKVDSDLAAGALTKPDGDELKREIAHVQQIEDEQSGLTGQTRRDLREDVAKIEKDLARKEATAKAMASASASPTP